MKIIHTLHEHTGVPIRFSPFKLKPVGGLAQSSVSELELQLSLLRSDLTVAAALPIEFVGSRQVVT